MKTRHSLFLAGLLALFPTLAQAQNLLQNAALSADLSGWSAGCNKFDASDNWTAYTDLAAGTGVSHVSGGARLSVVSDASATYTETVFLQAVPGRYFQSGDVIHFKGSYSVAVTKNGSGAIRARLFIRGMDAWYNAKSWSAEFSPSFDSVAGKTTSGTFELAATVGDLSSFYVVQIGASLHENDATDDAALTVSGLSAWLNSDETTPVGTVTAGRWAGYTVDPSGYVDTGDWLGWIYPVGDWIWSCRFGRWIYLPEWYVREGGSWMYMMGE